MSKLSIKLEKILTKKLEYPCEVWFNKKHPYYGWIFKTDRTYPQIIAFSYQKAVNLIENSKTLEIMKKQLSKSKNKAE